MRFWFCLSGAYVTAPVSLNAESCSNEQ